MGHTVKDDIKTLHLQDNDPLIYDEAMNHNIPYVFVIGPIVYAMLCTRQDVTFSLSITRNFGLTQ